MLLASLIDFPSYTYYKRIVIRGDVEGPQAMSRFGDLLFSNIPRKCFSSEVLYDTGPTRFRDESFAAAS